MNNLHTLIEEVKEVLLVGYQHKENDQMVEMIKSVDTKQIQESVESLLKILDK